MKFSFFASLAVALVLSPAASFAAPLLLKDINNTVAMPTEQPVRMGDWWYFRSCTEGTGCELWKFHDTGTTAYLVADINPGPASSNPTSLAVLGSTLFFAADNGTSGIELWKSDGTAAGTSLFVDINPGTGSSSPSGMIVAGSTLYFNATAPASGAELWKSDGTPAGTVLVKDIVPGGAGSNPYKLTAMGSLVIFYAYPGLTLWRSDGTEAGTYFVRGSTLLAAFHPVDGSHLLFATFGSLGANTLWSTDGTVAGTVDLGVRAGWDVVLAGSTAFFMGTQGLVGQGLWTTDGTLAGTRLVKAFPTVTGFVASNAMTPVGNNIIFAESDGGPARKWWRSDGTESGTYVLEGVSTLPDGSAGGLTGSLGSLAIFLGYDAAAGSEPWVTDSTLAGTHRLKDIHPGSLSSEIRQIVRAGSKIFFVARTFYPEDPRLWKSDGTEAGTVQLGTGTQIQDQFAIGERLLYSYGLTFADAAWISDGTMPGTAPLASGDGQPNRGSSCGYTPTVFRSLVIFPAFDAIHGCELWRTDGTPQGTYFLKDTRPGADSPFLSEFAVAGQWLYFVSDQRFWKTDGTPEGTSVVGNGDSTGQFAPRNMTVSGTALYFVNSSINASRVLMRTTIGSSDAQPVYVFESPPTGSLERLAGGQSLLYFAFGPGSYANQLWKTDGTPAGNELIKIDMPGAPLVLDKMVALGQVAYFTNSASTLSHLWKSDGTSEGTLPVLDAGSRGIFGIVSLVTTGGVVYANAADGLWRSNGTPPTTFRVASTSTCSAPFALIPAGPYLYFGCFTAATGNELWRSNGTVEGTFALGDMNPGSADGYLGIASVLGQGLYFQANTSNAQTSIWFTNGTPETTRKLFDLAAPFPTLTAFPAGIFSFEVDPMAGLEPSLYAGTPSLDSDGDGIPDAQEAFEGRDPFIKDNDLFTSARLFAMQQYRDFLAREGDAVGINQWVNYLNAGGTRAATVEGFFASGEFQNYISPVARLYFAYFLRIPDYDGLTFWINYYRAGYALSTISDAFAESGEFTSRYGALSIDQFVDLVYQNVLGRPADAGGKAYWLGQLNGGMTRGTMMLGFSESAEYVSSIRNEVNVTMTYVGMLRRAPDSGGFGFWVNYLDGGQSQQALIDGFLAAPEYRSRFLP